MNPSPTAVGLFLCEQVIVDQHSRNPSPINIFTGMAVEAFPSARQRFSAFATLTEGNGNATMKLVANRLDTGDEVYSRSYPIGFPDRVAVVNIMIRLNDISFPAAGVYEFVLLVDGDSIARRRLRVYSR